MTDTFRAMCAELVEELANETSLYPGHERNVVTRARALLAQPVAEGPMDEELIKMWATIRYIDQPGRLAFARAVLARWGRPTPQPPADGEVAELVAWLRATGKLLHPDYSKSRIPYMRAADLLQRLASDNAGLTAAADSLWADNVSLLDEHQ